MFRRLLLDVDLVNPDENAMKALLAEYDDHVGTSNALAPVDGGILFFDFKGKVIYQTQHIAEFPAIHRDAVLNAVFKTPHAFDRYVPHFKSKTVLPPQPFEGAYVCLEPIEVTFTRATDQESLWINADLKPRAGAYQRIGDGGRVVEEIKAVVPTADYLALMVDLPGWTVRSCETDDPQGIVALRTEMGEMIEFAQTDLSEWDEFITAAASRGRND